MKTRHLFAGCSVTIEPHDDVWLVSLKTDNQHVLTIQTYHELPDAIESVYEWTIMLSDETEIRVDDDSLRTAVTLVREKLARLALGEDAMPANIDEVVLRDQLRAWFEREMGEK